MLTAVLSGAGLLIGGAASPASAYDGIFPTPNDNWLCADMYAVPCLADSAIQSYDFSPSLPNYLQSAVSATLIDSYRWTDVDFGRVDYTVNVTDVYYMSVTWLPSGTYGRVQCREALNSSRCKAFHASHSYEQRGNPDHLQWLACHETGHTVGLVHGEFTDPVQSNSAAAMECMKTGTYTPSQAKELGSRQAGEINSAY